MATVDRPGAGKVSGVGFRIRRRAHDACRVRRSAIWTGSQGRVGALCVCLALAVPDAGFARHEFVRKETWEATEAANPAPDRPLVPAKWLVSPDGEVGDIRFFRLSGPGDTTEWSRMLRTGKMSPGWRIVRPAANGTFDLGKTADVEWNTQVLYAEFEAPHEELALLSLGCTDGWRSEINGVHVDYKKWRQGPFLRNEFLRVVAVRKGVNQAFMRIMRRAGEGKAQFVVRPLGRRLDLLMFLVESFPSEASRMGEAAEEALGIMRLLYFSERERSHRDRIDRLRGLLRDRITGGIRDIRVLSVFIDLSTSYRRLDGGTMPFVAEQLARTSSDHPRLAAGAIAYHKYAGSDAAVPGLLERLKRCEPDESWIKAFHRTCLDARMFREGIDVLEAACARADGLLKVRIAALMADLAERSGEYAAAQGIYESIREHEDHLQMTMYCSPERKARQIRNQSGMRDAILPEAFGVDEAMEVIRNTVEAGDYDRAAADFLAKADVLRDMVVKTGPGSAVDSYDYFMQKIDSLPKGFQDAVKGLLEEQMGAGLEGDTRTMLRRSWDVLRGRGEVNRLAVEEAGRLLDSGSFNLAKMWLKAAWQAERSAPTAAALAFASAAAGDRNMLRYLRDTMAAAEQAQPVVLAGRQTTLGVYIGSLEAREERTAGPGDPTPESFTAGWRSKLSYVPKIGASYPRDPPRPSAPYRLLPHLRGDTLVVFTGTGLSAYNVRSGAGLWSTTTTHAIERGWKGRFPVPVFKPVAQGPLLITRVPREISPGAGSLCDSYLICAVDLRDGRMAWSRGNITSDPVLEEGMLYFNELHTGRREDTTVDAVAAEPSTGRVIWRRPLLVVGFDQRGESGVREVTPPLPTPRGVVFSTGHGVVAMLHPLTGNVVWLRRYSRPPQNELVSAMHVSPSAYHDGRILVAPRDSHRVYAFDLGSGETIWEESTCRSPYLAGVWNGKLVMLGDAIRLLDAATGKETAKRAVKLPPFPYPAIARDRLAVYGLERAVAFNLQTLRETPCPWRLEENQYFVHPLGNYAVLVEEGAFSVHASAKSLFDEIAPERVFENAALALAEGREEGTLDLYDKTGTSAISPGDLAVYRMLLAKRLQAKGMSEEAKAAGAALLEVARDMPALAWRRNHTLRPGQLAHRLMGDNGEYGQPVNLPQPAPDARPMPLWFRRTDLPGIAAPPRCRGVLLAWSGDRARLLRLEGLGETIWERQWDSVLRSVAWFGDVLIARRERGVVEAIDSFTGEELWSTSDPSGSLLFVSSSAGLFIYSREHPTIRCADPRTGKDRWQVSLPDRCYPYLVAERDGKLYAIGNRSNQELDDWRLYEVDALQRRVGRELFRDHRTEPLVIDGPFLITRVKDGTRLFAHDLASGKNVWTGIFGEPMSARRIARQGGDPWLGICDARDGRLVQLVDPSTGEVVADAGKDAMHYFGGDTYLLNRSRNAISKVALAGRSETRAEGVTDNVSEDLSDDLSADLGLAVGKRSTSTVGDIRLVDWETTLPKADSTAWHWGPGALTVLSVHGAGTELLALDLKTGRLRARDPLIHPPSPVRRVQWLYGGRYCLIQAESEFYCLKMVPGDQCPEFAAERRAIAERTVDPGDRGVGLRTARLADAMCRGTREIYAAGRGYVDLKESSNWIPAVSGAEWGGEEDVSGRVRVEQGKQRDLRFSVLVRDDRWNPYRKGGDGDCVVLELGGHTFVVGMDGYGRAVVESPGAGPEDAGPPLAAASARMLSADSILYSFGMPAWQETIRPDYDPKTRARQVGFRVAIHDDDGNGVEGQMEWGIGRNVLTVR